VKDTPRMRVSAKFENAGAAYAALKKLLDEAPFERPEERETWRKAVEEALLHLGGAMAHDVCFAANICAPCVIRLQAQLAEVNLARASVPS